MFHRVIKKELIERTKVKHVPLRKFILHVPGCGGRGGGGEGVSVNDEMRKKQIKDGLYVPISLKMK